MSARVKLHVYIIIIVSLGQPNFIIARTQGHTSTSDFNGPTRAFVAQIHKRRGRVGVQSTSTSEIKTCSGYEEGRIGIYIYTPAPDVFA